MDEGLNLASYCCQGRIYFPHTGGIKMGHGSGSLLTVIGGSVSNLIRCCDLHPMVVAPQGWVSIRE